MNAPRDTAIAPQEQDTNRSGQSSRQPPAEPYNAAEVELLSVGDGESEHDGEHDSENDREWPCICGDGLNTDGTWIRCDQSSCPFTWYHLACVGLKNAPPGKWICPQCQARTGNISKKKPRPKRKGTAVVKAPQKKEQVRWKGWKELHSDEEEQFKQNVESSWAAQIIPGKTRRGPRQDAPCSEDESESIGIGQSPSQQVQMDILRQSTADPSLQSGSSDDDQNAWMSELIVGPRDMTTDDKAASPEEAEAESTDWETVMDDDDRAASQGEDESEYESTDSDTVMDGGDRAASPGEDEAGSTDWETVMDEDDSAESPGEDESESESSDRDTVMNGDDGAASPGEDESESTDGDTVMEVDDIADFIIKTARESDHVSDDPTGRSSGMAAPEAASVQVSGASTTTEPTAGDQPLVSALKGNWAGQYFA